MAIKITYFVHVGHCEVAAQLFGVENLSKNWGYLTSAGELKTPEMILSDAGKYDTLSPCDGCGCSACK